MQSYLKAAAAVLFCSIACFGWFPVNGTFLNFYRDMDYSTWNAEFQNMSAHGMREVFILSVGHLDANGKVSADGLLYPSAVAAGASGLPDRLGMILNLADTYGMKVHVGSLQTAGDWTTGLEFSALRSANKLVAEEVKAKYGSHPSLAGWFFTQEIWINWIKASGSGYYGLTILRNFRDDMKAVNPAWKISAAPVFKKDGYGSMPGLTPGELGDTLGTFLSVTGIDRVMPQDGIGAGAGAPPLSEIGTYFSAASSAASRYGAELWSTIEAFNAVGTNPAKYPPTDMARFSSQVAAEQPYVSGFCMWIFGDHMADMPTYWPVEATQMLRDYNWYFLGIPQVVAQRVAAYQYSRLPAANWNDASFSKLRDGTGGGYDDNASWVGVTSETPEAFSVTLDLGTRRDVGQVKVLLRSQTDSYIRFPTHVKVEVSNDGSSFFQAYDADTGMQDTVSFSRAWLIADLPGFNCSGTCYYPQTSNQMQVRYVRVTLTHLYWLMMAEVQAIGISNEMRW